LLSSEVVGAAVTLGLTAARALKTVEFAL